MKRSLIIFARNPVLGKIKTRLAASIGEQKAYEVYNELLEIVRDYTVKLDFSKVIYWDEGIPTENPFNGKEYKNKMQVSGDLGTKMKSAFEEECKSYDSVCIIGSDCPELTESIIESAFDSLNRNDIVLGPAVDGGYYLLGMKRLHESLFDEIDWSTEKVFKQTLNKIDGLSLKCHILKTLYDIDTIEDYNRMILNISRKVL